MNRIIENANSFEQNLATFTPEERDAFEQKLSLTTEEVFAFKDAIAIGQLEGRITLAEAETLQHVVAITGWRSGTSLGMRAAVYLVCAELIGVNVQARVCDEEGHDLHDGPVTGLCSCGHPVGEHQTGEGPWSGFCFDHDCKCEQPREVVWSGDIKEE